MLFPIRDDNPTYGKPYVTVGLIILNALVFLYTRSLGARSFEIFLFHWGYTPDFIFGDLASMAPASIYLTPLTSMFLHGGWLHLIGNMWFLWIFGNNVEDYFGPTKYILFYLVSGIAAIALYTLFNPGSQVPLVGASGAIAGVMGAYIVLHPRADITCLLFFFFITFVTLPAKIVLGLWFFYQILMSLLGSTSGGGVAWLAHVGGFVFGWALLKAVIRFRGGGTTPRGGQRVYKIQW